MHYIHASAFEHHSIVISAGRCESIFAVYIIYFALSLSLDDVLVTLLPQVSKGPRMNGLETICICYYYFTNIVGTFVNRFLEQSSLPLPVHYASPSSI